jgi:hypothetical protein
MLIFSPPEPPPLVAQLQIAHPQESAPAGRPDVHVMSPGGSSESENRETGAEREQRLMDKGIVPTPAPPVPKDQRSTLEKAAAAVAQQAKNEDGSLKPLLLRTEMNCGSWWSPVLPKNTTYLYDFSYGGAVLFPFGTESISKDQEGASEFLGVEFASFNGAAYVVTDDIWGGKSPVYAEINVMELGPVAALFFDKSIGENQNVSWDVRLSLMPVKWVKAVSYADVNASSKSDAVTHTAVNWAGTSASVGVAWGWARLAEVGVFAGIYTSTPIQLRSRLGIKVSLLGR